ncbi:MAG TPA: polysaccharide deacetylase family protein [Jatrophihabitantaceae bacterium]|nr:polysaccharide deacetylase family protein [Jatrophihabitantaceae bacterium]
MRRVSRAAGELARPAALASRAVSAARRLTIVGWHRIGPGGTGLDTPVDEFRRQLDVLAEWGAVVLSLERATQLLAQDAVPEHAVVLTFDDGYASVAESAWPLLRDRGWPATMFAVSGYLDGARAFPWDEGSAAANCRLLDWAGLRELADAGMDIGSHSVSHPWLPELPPQQLDHELRSSKACLEDGLGRAVTSFAYPTGGWDRRVRAVADQAGYTTAVTVDRGRSRHGHDPLALRRAFAFTGQRDFRLQLDGAFDWMRPVELYRLRRRPSWS